jgi:hypothetical protein
MSDITAKIETQAASLQKKIDALSGNYLTNTWKRQQEQKWRDEQKERLVLQKQMLDYLGEEALCRELTAFEKALISGAFYEDTRSLLTQKQRSDERGDRYTFEFPERAEQMAKRLRKAGINTTAELVSALEAYAGLIAKAVIPPDPKAARIRDLTFQARLWQKGDVQFTPAALTAQLIDLSGIDGGSRVLEPEAGIGSIADEVKKITPQVDCIEPTPSFRELLALKGHNLIGADLLSCEPRPDYDAVIMNPPFSEECRHLRYAYDFVKPGGCLTAVCSVRIQECDQTKYREFGDWLNGQRFHIHPVTEKFEMTGTNTVVLVIEKDAA